MSQPLKTEFAPPERADAATVEAQAIVVSEFGNVAKLYDAVNDLVFVLNRERQIVVANRNVTTLLGLADDATLRGKRPGEAFRCVHACDMPAGCGTSKFCSTCGAVRAILTSLAGRPDVQECRLMRDEPLESLDLLARTTPLVVPARGLGVLPGGETFTVCAIADITHEKRRRALERVFFHDVMNTAFSAYTLARGFEAEGAPEAEKVRPLLAAVEQIVREIAEQRDLMAAETSELGVTRREFPPKEFLASLVETQRRTALGKTHAIALDVPDEELRMTSDPVLLGRVLNNMIRNALEATLPGERVTVRLKREGTGVEFSVHNPGEMPEEVRLQIFKRSFSTKGEGRGLGTWSIKLLTERYLGGNVSFSSSGKDGTTFRVSLLPGGKAGGRPDTK